MLRRLESEAAKRVAPTTTATPPIPAPRLDESPVVRITALRGTGEEAITAQDRPGVRAVVERLVAQIAALGVPAAPEDPPEATAYQRTSSEWAELLLGGAWQAWGDLWRQDVRALAGAADYPALTRAIAEAEEELRRLESVAPASLLAGWYQQAVQALAAEIALARAIEAGLTTVEDATALGWGVVPIFPALSDIPIDGGLLPVPQEFHVAGPEPGVAYYNVPANALWGVGRTVGPSCGTYPSPYASSRSIVRWGTYGYGGCVKPAPDGQPAQFEAVVLPSTPPGQAPAMPTPTATTALAAATRTPTPVISPPTRIPAPSATSVPQRTCFYADGRYSIDGSTGAIRIRVDWSARTGSYELQTDFHVGSEGRTTGGSYSASDGRLSVPLRRRMWIYTGRSSSATTVTDGELRGTLGLNGGSGTVAGTGERGSFSGTWTTGAASTWSC